MIAVPVLCVQTACATVADMKKNNTKNVALSAVFTAISVVLCLLASVFETMSLSIIAVCGFVSAITLSQCGYKYALLKYVATALLSVLLVPNKECAIYYTLLFGYYPILKVFIERVGKRWLIWCIKLIFANLAVFVTLYIVVNLIGPFGIASFAGKSAFFVLYNIAFVLYDICVGRVSVFYMGKLGKRAKFR